MLFVGYIAGPGVPQFTRCLWQYSAAGLELVARTGDVLPGMAWDEYVDGLGGPGDMSLRGNFVFRADLPGFNLYRYGFWAGTVDEIQPVALWNRPAPGGDVFWGLYDARINRGGEVFFSVVMRNSHQSEYWSIWRWRPDGDLLRVARQGEHPPGIPDGYALAQLGIAGGVVSDQVLRNPTIAASGRVVYWGLATGPGPTIDGLWTGNPDVGMEFALGTGTTFTDTSGKEHQTTRTLNFFEINDQGRIVTLVGTTDGSTAILRVSPH